MTPEELWDNLSVETYLNGSAITGVSTQAPTMTEIIEETKRMRAMVDTSRMKLRHFVLTMEPCGLCHHKAKYIEPPGERIQFCRCRVAELKRQSASVPNYMPDQLTVFPQFMGIEIETVG